MIAEKRSILDWPTTASTEEVTIFQLPRIKYIITGYQSIQPRKTLYKLINKLSVLSWNALRMREYMLLLKTDIDIDITFAAVAVFNIPRITITMKWTILIDTFRVLLTVV